MKSPTAYFLLGAATASVIWLLVLAYLDAELLRTFMSFGRG
jgi:arginine exporter protein ArgO